MRNRVQANTVCIFDKDNNLGHKEESVLLVRTLKKVKKGLLSKPVWLCQAYNEHRTIYISEKYLYPIDDSSLCELVPNYNEFIVVRNPVNMPEIRDDEVAFIDNLVDLYAEVMKEDEINQLKKINTKLKFYNSMGYRERKWCNIREGNKMSSLVYFFRMEVRLIDQGDKRSYWYVSRLRCRLFSQHERIKNLYKKILDAEYYKKLFRKFNLPYNRKTFQQDIDKFLSIDIIITRIQPDPTYNFYNNYTTIDFISDIVTKYKEINCIKNKIVERSNLFIEFCDRKLRCFEGRVFMGYNDDVTRVYRFKQKDNKLIWEDKWLNNKINEKKGVK